MLVPRRDDLHRIAVIGSGPIVIGQACEFDYSGVQALRVLREEGYETVLVNSNPATIMTDPGWADRTYLEPLDLEGVSGVLRRERPDALLPTLGGQTALNLAMQLSDAGILDELGIELIGASKHAIETAEDRLLFAQAMERVGLRCARSEVAHSVEEARALVESGQVRLPAVIRPAFTLGGQGGGFANTPEELDTVVARGVAASPIDQVLVEESVRGWGEFELEVIRDRVDNVVIVCSIENLDPMGVHTGDSVCVAPAMTLSDREYQTLRDAAATVIRAVGVETGGSNVQFALEPRDGRARGDRDEPARVALLGAGLQGHGLPHRQGGHEARAGLHAGRDPERPHGHHAGLVRADAGLRGGQAAALRLREVRRRRRAADDAHEERRRGHGHRPHLLRVVRQGHAQPRARHPAAARGPARRAAVGPLRHAAGPPGPRRAARRAVRGVRRPPVVRGRARLHGRRA